MVRMEFNMEIKGITKGENILWMLAYEEILTKFGRQRRRLTDNSDCIRSSRGCEDALHLIRYCRTLREACECLQPTIMLDGYYSLNLQEWMLRYLRYKGWSRRGAEWPEIMTNV